MVLSVESPWLQKVAIFTPGVGHNADLFVSTAVGGSNWLISTLTSFISILQKQKVMLLTPMNSDSDSVTFVSA